MGLLSNGDGVICTWGGSQKSNGEVWIVPNLASGNPGLPKRIATGLREALGVAVVGNDFYVLEKPRILKFSGSGADWTKSTVFTLGTDWYNDIQWFHFSYNLIYHDNAFWFTLNSLSPDSGFTTRLVGQVGEFSRRIHASMHRNVVSFDVPFHGPWKIDLVRLDGTHVARSAGSGPGRFESASLPPGLYLVAGRAEGAAFSEKVQVAPVLPSRIIRAPGNPRPLTPSRTVP